MRVSKDTWEGPKWCVSKINFWKVLILIMFHKGSPFTKQTTENEVSIFVVIFRMLLIKANEENLTFLEKSFRYRVFDVMPSLKYSRKNL